MNPVIPMTAQALPATELAGTGASATSAPAAAVPEAPAISAAGAATPAAPMTPASVTPVTPHAVFAGETLWSIAADYYREPLFWPLIYYYNRYTIIDPDVIQVGQVLQLQPLGGTGGNLLSNDSLVLGQAFQAVYGVYRSKGKQHADMYRQVALQFHTK